MQQSQDEISLANLFEHNCSDFGSFKIIPDRFQRARDCWFIDFDFWAIAFLRPFATESLAKTGDSIKQMLISEYGLMSKNQAANGFLADV